jgi:beta-lactamase class A
MIKKIFLLVSLLLHYAVSVTFGQQDVLRQKIGQIVSSAKADIGVAIYGLEGKDTLSINGNKHFPMQSVYKFHIALAVLNKTDKGEFSLDQQIFIKKSDLLTNTWSPLQQKYPDGNIAFSLRDILSYTVSQSDNNGCDILFRLMGGTEEVENYIHSIGIKNISIKATEEEMGKDWNVQFTNWTTPLSAIELLKKFYEREILSKNSYELLWKLMLESSAGQNRIKGNLPAGTSVAHKTGTSGTNKQGISAAVNDIGIITLPNGKHVAISVFVSNSNESSERNEKIIADIARVTWDYFITNH